jgi:uncharacterized protein (TIGR02147 family)
LDSSDRTYPSGTSDVWRELEGMPAGEPLYNSTLVRELSKATDYRKYLITIMDAHERARGRGTKALISRRAGFASRSYLTEILNGKKGLSRDAMVRIRTALKLRGPLAKFFECLAALEHPEIRIHEMNPARLREKIKSLRTELTNFSEEQNKIASPHLQNPEIFQVYAALGPEAVGATIQEVLFRTKISESMARKGLGQLISSGAVLKNKDRYHAVASKTDALSSQDEIAISEMIQKVCASIQKNRQQIVADKKSLGIYSAFSVRREKIGELKKSLEAALFEVLDEYQDDSGDCVEQVFLSLFRRPLESAIN